MHQHVRRYADERDVELLASSEGLGWEGVQVRAMREPAVAEQWSAEASPDLRLILLRSGAMQMEQRRPGTAWRPYSIAEGDLFLRPPGRERYELRWASPAARPIETLSIDVRASIVRQVAAEMGADPARLEVVERVGFQDRLLAQIGLALMAGLEQRGPADGFYAQTAGRLLVSHVLRHYTLGRRLSPETPQGLTPRQLRRVTEYVNAHLDQELTVEALAEQAGYSPYHFTRLFRQATGQSPYQFVLRERVARARQLLEESELPVVAVARAAGFANQSHLTHVFRRTLGVTPHAARLAAGNRAAQG